MMELFSNSFHFITSLFLILYLQFSTGEVEIPSIISRKEWGAIEPNKINKQITPVPFVVLHHGGIEKYCFNLTYCSELVREYQALHMKDRKWDDIGYNFLIGEDGNVYEGRGWKRVGAHAPLYNNQSIGIAIIGDFSNHLPNEKAIKTYHNLVEWGVNENMIIKNYSLLGHRQARVTKCPGEKFYEEIQTWEHWDPNPSPFKYNNSNKLNYNFINIVLLLLIYILNN